MKARIYFMLLAFPLFTGATFPAAKYAVQYFPALSAASWRFGLAAVCLLLVLAATEGIRKQVVRENGIAFFILGLLGIFGFNLFFFLGMKQTSSVNGALIMATNPLLTVLLARIILNHAITARQTAGLILSLFGVLAVITHGSWELVRSLAFSAGDLFILAGNLCWALYSVLTRRLVKNSSSLATTTYTMLTGAAVLLIVSFLTPQPVSAVSIPLMAWTAILFMAFFTSVLGYLWWNKGVQELGPGKTSIFFNFVPIVTMLLSFAAGIPISSVQWYGAALVLTGVFVSAEYTFIRKRVPKPSY
jgi:drug/metabolite transporter (DMT)-like permease